MNKLEKALNKLIELDKRKPSKLYLKALKEGKIKHDKGKE